MTVCKLLFTQHYHRERIYKSICYEGWPNLASYFQSEGAPNPYSVCIDTRLDALIGSDVFDMFGKCLFYGRYNFNVKWTLKYCTAVRLSCAMEPSRQQQLGVAMNRTIELNEADHFFVSTNCCIDDGKDTSYESIAMEPVIDLTPRTYSLKNERQSRYCSFYEQVSDFRHKDINSFTVEINRVRSFQSNENHIQQHRTCSSKVQYETPRNVYQNHRCRTNRRKRERNVSINHAFAQLRCTIPNIPGNAKVPKIKILQLASGYIAYLRNILEGQDLQDKVRNICSYFYRLPELHISFIFILRQSFYQSFLTGGFTRTQGVRWRSRHMPDSCRRRHTDFY